MTRTPDLSDPRDLLGHSRWLRAFADALVSGGGEDIAQEAWLRFVQRGPRKPVSQRGWLAMVARRVQISAHRSDRQRQQRKRVVAASQDVHSSTADLAAQAELLQLAVNELMALKRRADGISRAGRDRCAPLHDPSDRHHRR